MIHIPLQCTNLYSNKMANMCRRNRGKGDRKSGSYNSWVHFPNNTEQKYCKWKRIIIRNITS